MKVLYGLCTWGLGHMTRSLPIMRRLVDEGHKLFIYTSDRPLIALKKEFGDKCEYIESVEYPSPYTKNGTFGLRITLMMPAIINAIMKEHREVLKLSRDLDIDILISDSEYGVFDKSKPSFFIFHQLRYVPPNFLFVLKNQTERFNYYFRNSFTKFIVPDFPFNGGLTGNLSHNLSYIDPEQVKYIGILSDYQRMNLPQDIDYLISLSGREPSRSVFEKKIVDQIGVLKGNVVLVRGMPENAERLKIPNVEVINYAGKGLRDELMNRAKFVIARSGYSTIMDMVELGKRGLLVPTPGQTEQEYLSEYLAEKLYFYSVDEEEIDLEKDIEIAKSYNGYRPPWRTEQSVEKFMDLISTTIGGKK
ncbi:MAG: glycosyltransferase family protein [Athalassotoga sp.]|uniref:glycosyltransferase family protein n=1 Tax=Athalassotoga sp. TaxID=2022597 RepID=UPI002699DC6D